MFKHGSTMFGLQFGIHLDQFVETLDPIRQWHLYQQVVNPLSLAPAKQVESLTQAADEAIAIAAEIHRAVPYEHYSPVRNSVALLSRCNVAAEAFADTVHRYVCSCEGSMPTTFGRMMFNLQHDHGVLNPIDIPIVIDTGASLSLTPYKEDFEEPPEECMLKELLNVSSTTNVEGVGTVAWKVIDFFGVVHTIRTRAYYVPTATIRLYSPQRHFSSH
jgi:hypothetical protein